MSEPLRATFFAFKRREGSALLGATVCYVLMAAALMAVIFVPMFGAFGFNFGAGMSSPPTPPDPMSALWVLPLGFVVMFFYCVLTASFEAACLRWMIRGERPGLFGMTLDQDTWRVYALYWIWFLCAVVGWIGFLIVNGLTSYLLTEHPIARVAIAAVYGLLMLIAAAALAPAAAVSIAERRLVFGDAAQATEAHFGSLLGTYALLLGAPWLLNSVWTPAWVLWKLQGNVAAYFERASDVESAIMAYNAATNAAMATPGARLEYWAFSAAMFVTAYVSMVLVYGANARVALLALQEGRIGRAAAQSA